MRDRRFPVSFIAHWYARLRMAALSWLAAAGLVAAGVLLGIGGVGMPVASASSAVRALMPTLRPGGTPTSGGLLVLAGSFHDHSTDSDGDASSSKIAAWEFAHRYELGLDFGGLSDHADYWPFTYRVPFGRSAWKRQARLGGQYSRDGFSFLRAFEYTSDQENHVSVIGSQKYLGGMHRNDLTLGPLERWLSANGALAEFNHPDGKGALQWDNLAFVPALAADFATIEVHGKQGFTSKDLARSDAGWYWLALTRGWTVGPVMNWDTHHWRKVFRQADTGVRCGELPRTLPCQRTLVLADAATPDAILRALRARRTTATEHPSLWATLRGPGGIWQGSTVKAGAGRRMTLTIEAGSSMWPLERVDIVSDNGIDPHAYYDGDNPAHARHIGRLAAGFYEEHRRFVRSGGHTVRKATIDRPPPQATIATVPLTGNHAIETIVVTIPSTKSLRPDRKHFFYAIVHAGLARAWTSPIFTGSSR